MDETDTFYLSDREVRECYERALSESKTLLSGVGNDRFLLMNREIDTAKQIKALSSLRSDAMYERSLSCIQGFFGLLYCSRNDEGDGAAGMEYSFVHHQFRDYFSAIWNGLLLQAMPCLEGGPALTNAYLNGAVWQEQKVHMLSEILMEHRNRSIFDEVDGVWKTPERRYAEQCIVTNALHRLRAPDEDRKCLTSNLLRVVLDGRRELSGMDLGELDLTGFSLYGIPCSRGLGRTTRLLAGFYGARISGQTLEPEGHRDEIIEIVYQSDKCYTFDLYGVIKCWDIRSGVLLDEWHSDVPDTFGASLNGNLKVSPDGRFLAARIQLPEVSGVNLIDTRREDGRGVAIRMDDCWNMEIRADKKLETMAFSGDSHSLLMLDASGKVYSYDCVAQRMEWKTDVRDLYRVTHIYQETTDDKVWLFTAYYSPADFNSELLWGGDGDEAEQEAEAEGECGVPCQIMTLDPQTGEVELQRGFCGSSGTSPAACFMPGRGAVLYYDGSRRSLMVGVGGEAAWEVFGEITARHEDETMRLYRHPDNRELFYIVYFDEIYLVSINGRFHCSVISRYQADAVNALARSRGQEDGLSFCPAMAPSGRYFVLMNEDGLYFEWDEKENAVRKKYNPFINDCVGLLEDRAGGQYVLVHRNNSVCFFDSVTDRLKGSVSLYDRDYEIGLCHLMEAERALIVALVRLDNEKVVALNVDTGLATLLFSTAHEFETVVMIDSDEESGRLLLTTQYRCCEIDLRSLEEWEIAPSADNRRFCCGQYGDGVLRIVEVEDRSDSEAEAPLCNVYSRDGDGYRLLGSEAIRELPPEMYPYFIYENGDLGMTGTIGSNGSQRFWVTEGFFLELPEGVAGPECEMPLEPYEEGFVWHRHELRHYGEFRDGDIHILSHDDRGALFMRNSRTICFADDIHGLTYEELDRALGEERGCFGGNAYWSYAMRLENGDLICNYDGDGLMRVDGDTGEIVREIAYTPGLVLWGCNFVGVDTSDEVRGVLRANGAIVGG